jgi:hypothetical protein
MRFNIFALIALSAALAACSNAPKPATSASYTPTPEEQRKIEQWAECVIPRAFQLDDGQLAPEAIAQQAMPACRHLSLIPPAKETEIIVRVIKEKREKDRKTGSAPAAPASAPPARSASGTPTSP